MHAAGARQWVRWRCREDGCAVNSERVVMSRLLPLLRRRRTSAAARCLVLAHLHRQTDGQTRDDRGAYCMLAERTTSSQRPYSMKHGEFDGKQQVGKVIARA